MKSKILITGSQGFIGKILVNEFKNSNKLILIRMAIPFLIWASLMFSLFMFYQISMLRGITSPQIMPPYMFKETLELYFMKHNITTLKRQNIKPSELTGFYEFDIWYTTNIN